MGHKLAFLHTSHVVIPIFAKLARELVPEVEVFHVSDDSLIRNTIAAQELTKSTIRRVAAMIESAHEGGAEAVMVTCSSIGASVKIARTLFDFPVLRVDEAMAEAAVALGRRIGVAATIRTTLEPTITLIRETAAAAERDVEVIPSLCEGAFEAVVAGDTERHDAMVSAALVTLRRQVDVVVLAQASMARVVAQLPLDSGPPVLSSPELAVRRIREVFALDLVAPSR
jgi:Asp/Glu/hydantoin racemase